MDGDLFVLGKCFPIHIWWDMIHAPERHAHTHKSVSRSILFILATTDDANQKHTQRDTQIRVDISPYKTDERHFRCNCVNVWRQVDKTS